MVLTIPSISLPFFPPSDAANPINSAGWEPPQVHFDACNPVGSPTDN